MANSELLATHQELKAPDNPAVYTSGHVPDVTGGGLGDGGGGKGDGGGGEGDGGGGEGDGGGGEGDGGGGEGDGGGGL